MIEFAAYRIKQFFARGLIGCLLVLLMITVLQQTGRKAALVLLLCAVAVSIWELLKILIAVVYTVVSCLAGIGWHTGELSKWRLRRCCLADGMNRNELSGKCLQYWKAPFLGVFVGGIKR